MIDPFLDGSYGEWMTEPCEMETVFRYYWNAGFQIHVHTNGDKAMELVLKMVKMMQKESPRPNHRTTIEHAGNVPLLVRHWPCNSNFKILWPGTKCSIQRGFYKKSVQIVSTAASNIGRGSLEKLNLLYHYG